MKYEKPDINPTFFYGRIVSYQFNGNISKNKGMYRYRFTLYFESGEIYHSQKSGFKTLKEAEKSKELLISNLVTQKYCPFNYSVKETFDYWLYEYMLNELQIRYNTYYSYCNVIYNYLIPSLGDKKMLRKVTAADLSKAINRISHFSVKQRACMIIKSFFGFAYNKHYIDYNPSVEALRSVDVDANKRKTRDVKPFTIQQIQHLLYTCKLEFQDMYIPLLLSITLGTRISETIAIKYSDIDFTGKTVYIERQLGYDFKDVVTDSNVKKEVATKTSNGIRYIPVPEWVLNELIVKRGWYETQKKRVLSFQDFNYVCCHCDGRPFQRDDFHKDFRKLLKMCGLPSIHWHDLRHMYTSILKNNSVNMKAISLYLGHGSPDFTENVYAYHEVLAHDCTILEEVWEVLKPLDTQASEETVMIPLEYSDLFNE